MKLTDERIEQNKQEFITLMWEIKDRRPQAKIEELVNKLESSDWFTAPASAKYHADCEGGLCQHSLNVFHHLEELSAKYEIDRTSILITGLLHDLSKMNLYETAYRNKKQYSETGSKRDDSGRFDWVVEKSYAMIDEESRFIFGNHEETSEFMVRTFIPLTVEESVAILYHHGGKGWDSSQAATQVFGRYNLPVLLHCADMISAYVDEK